jgi:hypothetical protein
MDGFSIRYMRPYDAIILKKFLKNIFRIIILIAFQALICAGIICGAETVLSPEMTVKNYFDAYIAQDWDICTEYLHPEMLQKFHEQIIGMVGKGSIFTRDALLRLYHVRSVEELKAMPPRELYMRYLQNHWNGLDSETTEELNVTKPALIRIKKIINDECQVECKLTVTLNNHTYDKVEAYYLKKYDGRWKIYSTEDLKKLDKHTTPDNILSPEITVKNYFQAYIDQDWEACTAYLHPAMLQKLHDRIIDMVDEVSFVTRDALLKQYHVRSVSELRAIPPRQLYIIYLQNRWDGLDSKTIEELNATKLSFAWTKRINNDECRVDCTSTATIKGQTYNKVETYYLKKYQDRWKIYSTEGLKKLDQQSRPERTKL